jgi:hypothetical protein
MNLLVEAARSDAFKDGKDNYPEWIVIKRGSYFDYPNTTAGYDASKWLNPLVLPAVDMEKMSVHHLLCNLSR